GLAVGRVGELAPAEAAEVGDRGVAVEDLLQEQVDGDDGPQVAFAPAVPDLTGQVFNEPGGDGIGIGTLEPLEGLCDGTHGGLLAMVWHRYLHHPRRPPLVPERLIHQEDKDLRLILMAFGIFLNDSATLQPSDRAAALCDRLA